METATEELDRLLDAALPHVPFEGWSAATFRRAVKDSGLTASHARMIAPRGGLDLAVAYHRRNDRRMVAALAEADLSTMRFRDRVAHALKLRLDAIGDREAVRRAAAMFSLPQNAAEGARMVWETADHVWTALGDTSDDLNWYTKRLTLSGVWSSTVLYWLGDDSPGFVDTHAFIDRRIEDVMQFEKLKSSFRDNPLGKAVSDGLEALVPRRWLRRRDDLPGQWQPPGGPAPR